QLRIQPVARGPPRLGGNDLHRLARSQAGKQGDHLPVHPRPPAAVPQVSVQVIGEIHRGSARWQLDDTRLRRHDINTLAGGISGANRRSTFWYAGWRG